MFSGYKTYIVAGLAILTAVGQYLSGDASLSEAIQLAVTAVLGVTLRQGIAKV